MNHQIISVSSTAGRSSFAGLLHRVFTEDIIVEIKKSGIPVAYLSKSMPTTSTKIDHNPLLQFAGAWSDMSEKEADELVTDIYTNRKLGSR